MDITKPSKEHIVIFELDVGVELDVGALWIKEIDSVWKLQYWWEEGRAVTSSYGFGLYGWGTYGAGGEQISPPAIRDKVFQMKSVIADNTQLTIALNLTEVKENINSFYFDTDNQVLYIHTETGKSPAEEYDSLILGVTRGFSNKSKYLENIFYESRILQAPSITNSRDNYFNQINTYEKSSITMNNTDGFFDDFEELDINGARCRLLYGIDDATYDEYIQFYSGYIEDFSTDKSKIKIDFIDERKNLSSVMTTNTYSDGSGIPLAYGKIKRAPAFNQDDEGLSEYVFQFVDTTLHNIYSIDGVYVDGVSKIPTATSTTEGTFILSSSDYEPGQDVSVDFTGFVDDSSIIIDNGLDIIKDLITTFTDNRYTSAYFNITEWESARAKVEGKNIGIYIDDTTTIIDIIEQISSSLFGIFIIQGDGKISYQLRDTTKESVKTISYEEIIEDLSIDRNSDEYCNSVKINYDKHWDEDDGPALIDTSRRDTLYSRFRKHKQQEFLIYLTNYTDVINFGVEALDTFGGVFPVYEVTTKMQNIDLTIVDNIFVDTSLRLRNRRQYEKCEIVSVTIDLNKFTCKIQARKIAE